MNVERARANVVRARREAQSLLVAMTGGEGPWNGIQRTAALRAIVQELGDAQADLMETGGEGDGCHDTAAGS